MKREDLIERILTYLTFAETWTAEDLPDYTTQSQLAYMVLPLSYFHGAEISPNIAPLNNSVNGNRIFNPLHPDNIELQTMDLGMWNACQIHYPTQSVPPHKGTTCLYHLARIRKVPLKEIRGFFQLMSGDVVEWAHGWIYNDGSFETSRAYFERRGSKWWAVGQPRAIKRPEWMGEEWDKQIFYAKALALTRYYDWRVEFGFEMPGRTMMPTISVATDPTAAKTVYRLRDIPPGKSRRDALRHWVQTHLRTNPYNHEEQIKIWAHLRGVEEFSHNGLKCRIVPSAHDLKKANEYQRLAQQEKENARRKVS